MERGSCMGVLPFAMNEAYLIAGNNPYLPPTPNNRDFTRVSKLIETNIETITEKTNSNNC